MELLTEELRKILPPLYSQERNKDPTVHIKFFTPDSNWTWYVTEGSEEEGEFIFFGTWWEWRRSGGILPCLISPQHVGFWGWALNET